VIQKRPLKCLSAWEERSEITDKVGRCLYVIIAYEKIKWIAFPLNRKHVLFSIINNITLKTLNKKIYGHLVEMRKTMSIVGFVNFSN